MKSKLLLVLSVLAMLAVASHAAKTHAIVVLGDDQSDRSNTYAVTKGAIPDNSTYYSGSWTNEPGVWSRQIDTPDSVISVRGFARGAATACPNAELLANGSRSLINQASDWSDKVSDPAYVASLQGVNATREVTLVIWGGHNDLILAAKEGDLNGAGDRVADCIQNVTSTMLQTTEVEFAGVVLVNLAPYDLSPVVAETGKAAEVKAAIEVFNRRLEAIADSTRSSLTGKPTKVVLVDINTALNNAVGNFTIVTETCVQYSGDYVPIEGGEPASVCDNPDDHVWYDSWHPSAAVHTAVKDAIANAMVDAGLIGQLIDEPAPAADPTTTPTARKLLL